MSWTGWTTSDTKGKVNANEQVRCPLRLNVHREEEGEEKRREKSAFLCFSFPPTAWWPLMPIMNQTPSNEMQFHINDSFTSGERREAEARHWDTRQFPGPSGEGSFSSSLPLPLSPSLSLARSIDYVRHNPSKNNNRHGKAKRRRVTRERRESNSCKANGQSKHKHLTLSVTRHWVCFAH